MKITKNLARTLKNCLGKDWRQKVRDLNFRGANFRGANFRGANFRGANFRDADFRGADFRGADFRGADFDNYEKIHLIALANACIYPLNITLQILKEAKEKTDVWKQNKTPLLRKCDDYDACESGWKKAFGSEDYVITENELHAFWFFCWRAE